MTMTVSKAVTFLAKEREVPKSALRVEKDKMRKRLIYAIGIGNLKVIMPGRLIERNDLITWAKPIWGNELAHLKCRVEADLEEKFDISGPTSAINCPATLEASHKRILELEMKLRSQFMQCLKHMQELENIRPLAMQYEKNRKTNRKNAKGPRK